VEKGAEAQGTHHISRPLEEPVSLHWLGLEHRLAELIPEPEKFSNPLYLKRDEIDRVLAHAGEKAKNGNFTDLRNAVILYLPFYGVRPEDIRRFKVGDIEFKSMKIGEERRC